MGYTKRKAEELFRKAYKYHVIGDVNKAIDLYKKSIEIEPTPKALTFLGWAYSMKGEFEKAIESCMKAIELDPDLGSPYNDIGTYLIEMGRFREAIPWLKKALVAKNYNSRHLTHTNLARAYLMMGKLHDALQEVKNALSIKPNFGPAHILKHQILAMLN